MSFDHKLRHKLNQRVDIFISEMEPSDGKFYTYSELMNQFRQSLEEFSTHVYGKRNEDFIKEQQEELNENISPAIMDMTDGADEIISSLLVIEIAKIIFQEGVDEETFSKKKYRPDLDQGREAIYRSIRYLYPDKDNGPHKKVFEKLGKYIFRNQKINQGSGCIITLIAIGSLSTLIIFNIA